MLFLVNVISFAISASSLSLKLTIFPKLYLFFAQCGFLLNAVYLCIEIVILGWCLSKQNLLMIQFIFKINDFK